MQTDIGIEPKIQTIKSFKIFIQNYFIMIQIHNLVQL